MAHRDVADESEITSLAREAELAEATGDLVAAAVAWRRVMLLRGGWFVQVLEADAVARRAVRRLAQLEAELWSVDAAIFTLRRLVDALPSVDVDEALAATAELVELYQRIDEWDAARARCRGALALAGGARPLQDRLLELASLAPAPVPIEQLVRDALRCARYAERPRSPLPPVHLRNSATTGQQQSRGR